MLGCKTSLNKFKRNEMTQSMFSDYNEIKSVTEGNVGNSQFLYEN